MKLIQRTTANLTFKSNSLKAMLTRWYYFTCCFKTSNADEVTGGKDICNLTMVLARH